MPNAYYRRLSYHEFVDLRMLIVDAGWSADSAAKLIGVSRMESRRVSKKYGWCKGAGRPSSATLLDEDTGKFYRICEKCEEAKWLKDFGAALSRPYGRNHVCKACRRKKR